MGGRYQQIKDWQGLTFKTYKQLIQLNIKKLHLPKNGQKTLFSTKKKDTCFLQRKQTDGQEAHEKMLNITNY